MIPYRGVRYHLKEQAQQGSKSQTKKELFNLRHSLRNAIERVFDIMKRRFRILRTAFEHSIRTQVGLIYALTGLNNFIHQHNNGILDGIDSEVTTEEAEVSDNVEDNDNSDDLDRVERGDKFMNAKREDIAIRMWVQYRQFVD